MPGARDRFSAAEQGLGYLYQIRFALLQMLKLSDEARCFIEKDDDLQIIDQNEKQILESLKHKSIGDRLSNLSPDFWRSVRIWLTRFRACPDKSKLPAFYLFTTGVVSAGSFLEHFLPNSKKPEDIVREADEVLSSTESKTLLEIKADLDQLNDEEKLAFLSQITIFDQQTRIQDIPGEAKGLMRTVRPQFRDHVFERIEGWWLNVAIDLMSGKRSEPAYGWELTEQLFVIADQFKADNLPIDFRKSEPPDGVQPDDDDRIFVKQLHALGLKTDRIRRAILDYYRAFEQRASWAREQVTVNGEVEAYDDRLVDEWDRFRTICFEKLDSSSSEAAMIEAGRELLHWAEMNDGTRLRIRPSVTEPYVMMGSYHMLANEGPIPRVHWHPNFIERLKQILSEKPQ